MPGSIEQLDTVSLSNLSVSVYTDGYSTATPLPPLNENFARGLTGLRDSVRKSGDPRIQFAFVNYLLEASEILLLDSNQLGIAFDSLPEGVTESDARNRMHKLFVDEAIKWLKKLATTSPGFGRQPLAEAQFALADFYGKGIYGLKVNHKEAFILYTQASKQGHPVAAFRTAVCYEFGAGTKRDSFRACQFYRKAAALGDPLAMHKMAKILLQGKLGQQKKLKEGLQWLKRAAVLADAKHPEALHDLALCFTKEEGLSIVIPDNQYVLELFKQASELGYAPSQHRLGTCYEFALLDCEVDPTESIKYYRLAAEQGYTDSQLALANWFLVGAPEASLPQSDLDAFRWAHRAANAGHIKAQYMLGHCYENGIGVAEPDLKEARQWYRRSAEQGYRRAVNRLNELDGKVNNKTMNWRRLFCIGQ